MIKSALARTLPSPASSLHASPHNIVSALLHNEPALTNILIVLVALSAGLAAAYGRRLQSGRAASLRWWTARLLLMPVLAITAFAAKSLLALSPSMTALTAAMLALGGYDCLRLVEQQWRARVLGSASKGPQGSQ